ncbi:ABC-2 transporter permease [Kosmotoga pacifica]|uniref:Uncharacterized protein n=1 Tax=Kosmotoga pacifica TaxID=1330330 RepID=A0A0G2ZD40_9BACT|nr:ABC-2 transporter permease [Kosmotoga pacifica]AKI97981.1 hypothetical protein IX53_09270 [Kosmotoga pacifica]
MMLKLLVGEFYKVRIFVLFWVMIAIFTMSLIYVNTDEQVRSILASLVGALIVTMGVFISISVVENYESQYHGYDFMLIMPLKLLDVISAKFVMLLIILGINVAAILPFILLSEIGPFSSRAMVISVELALLLGGIFHLGIARFGFEKFLYIFFFGFGTAGFVMLLILQTTDGTKNLEYLERLSELISRWPMVIVSILIYFVLLVITAKVKARYLNR